MFFWYFRATKSPKLITIHWQQKEKLNWDPHLVGSVFFKTLMKKIPVKFLMMLKVLKKFILFFLFLLNCAFWSPCMGRELKNLTMALICKYNCYTIVIKTQNLKYASNANNDVQVVVMNAYFSRRACWASQKRPLEIS